MIRCHSCRKWTHGLDGYCPECWQGVRLSQKARTRSDPHGITPKPGVKLSDQDLFLISHVSKMDAQTNDAWGDYMDGERAEPL